MRENPYFFKINISNMHYINSLGIDKVFVTKRRILYKNQKAHCDFSQWALVKI